MFRRSGIPGSSGSLCRGTSPEVSSADAISAGYGMWQVKTASDTKSYAGRVR